MKYKNTDIDIRDVQQIELEILIEFDRICKFYSIPYQLFGGTLLGAIRHKGFIPWDDDIDVCMLRKDYEYFLSVYKNVLSNQFFLQTCYTDKTSIVQFAKIRRKETIFKTGKDLESSENVGIYIDIFPMDNIKPSSFLGKMQPKIFSFFYALSSSTNINRVIRSRKGIIRITRKMFYYLSKIIPKKVFDDQAQKALKLFDNSYTEYVSHLSNGASKKRYYKFMRKAKDFNNNILHTFEGHMFPIPKNYDEVLKRIYGDYMTLPPKEEQYPHHGVEEIIFYPTYKKSILEKTKE